MSASGGFAWELCFLCDDPVLGIRGQDCRLSQRRFAGDPLDVMTDGAGVGGPCHIRCLEESAFAGPWAQRVAAEARAGSRPDLVAEEAGALVARILGPDDFILVAGTGWNCRVSAGELDSARRVGERLMMSARDVLADVRTPLGAGVHAALGMEAREGIVPLVELVDLVGVRGRLLSEDSLDGGWLTVGRMRESWRGRVSLGPYKNSKGLVLMSFDIDLAPGLHRMARTLGRPVGPHG
ncbi:hypothetical protein [Streptacidiphilus sp. PAMC 29251]